LFDFAENITKGLKLKNLGDFKGKHGFTKDGTEEI